MENGDAAVHRLGARVAIHGGWENQDKEGGRMSVIRGFRDLNVYQMSREEARKLFAAMKRFPKEGRYSLTDQIRRSSRAVNAMLAEAWARKTYRAAFVNKIDEALGEAMETQAWLDHALACEYLSAEEHRQLDGGWQNIGAMLRRMMDRADTFCASNQR